MRYYERIFLTEPGKKVLELAEAVVPLIVDGKKIWHVLFSQEARDKIEKDTKLAAKAQRITSYAKTARWNKLPHIFGPGRKPDLDDALDEDAYKIRETKEKELMNNEIIDRRLKRG